MTLMPVFLVTTAWKAFLAVNFSSGPGLGRDDVLHSAYGTSTVYS
jgi:hypothetical protein